MLDLESAIKHCEEVAEELGKRVKPYQCESINKKLYEVNKEEWDNCIECAQEHRQLAEWLEELKTYQEGIEYIKSRINYFSDLGMWDVVNSLELALEILGVENDNSDV